MEAIRSNPPGPNETACPACGIIISTSSIGRRRRVQCPKCREIVELGTAEKPVPKIAALPPVPPEEARVPAATIAALEARVAALEQAVKATAPVQPIEIVVHRPERKWRWLTHSPAHEAEKLPTNVTEVFLQNLGNYDGHTIAIRIVGRDPHTASRAASLKDVFERAQWNVEGPVEAAPRNSETGLFLAVGGLPLPPAATAAYFAMTTSGFTIQSFFDPRLRNDETVLIVA